MSRQKFIIILVAALCLSQIYRWRRNQAPTPQADQMNLDSEGFPIGSFYVGDPIRQVRHPKLQVLEMTDREPLAIAFHVGEPDAELLGKLESLFVRWEKTRKQTVGCECSSASFEAGGRVSPDEPFCCEFGCEWICERCLPDLLETVDRDIPSIERVVVGSHQEENPPKEGPFWIEVPSRTLVIDSVGTLEVPAFTISRYEVSVKEFHEFTQATGYITDAERRGDVSFRAHEAVSGLPRKSLLECSATQISWADANAYCQWKGVRLPETYEAVSASIPRIQFQQEYDRIRHENLQARRMIDLQPEAEQSLQQERKPEMTQWWSTWTSTKGTDQYCPFGFYVGNWQANIEREGQHCKVRFKRPTSPITVLVLPEVAQVPNLDGDLMTGFVVIRPSNNLVPGESQKP